MKEFLPTGKLPVELLAQLIKQIPTDDPRVLLGPGIGLDCAVLDLGETLLVLKSDPITFTSEQIGWYAVQVNANDIATTGATPRWLLTTLLLPENQTNTELVLEISQQLNHACDEIGVKIIGGHSEITYGLDRPILVSTMIGEVSRQGLVTPLGMQPGDSLLLTKGVPIEATAILAREFPDRLLNGEGDEINKAAYPLKKDELEEAQGFLTKPGISVLRDAQFASKAGQVHAMHDPTEGGLYAALWELAEASGCSISVTLEPDIVPPLSARICQILGLDPLASIASGALLLATPPEEENSIRETLEREGIACSKIGEVLERHSPPTVWRVVSEGMEPLARPPRDEIARYFAEKDDLHHST